MQEIFDYVIVGAGSAGCVLAERLSAADRSRVLLLEAGGPDKKFEIRVPAAFSKLFKTPLDWAYHSEPQENLHGRSLYIPRGKMLGGSSSMNAMIYVRGNARDYDRWAELGCEGWAFRDVLPFFKRSQHQGRGASALHGVGGPLHVADQVCVNPLSRALVAAAIEAGHKLNPDFNGTEQDGFGFYQVTQKNGRRWSAADAFLRPALGRPNLTVRTGEHVGRVLFEGTRAIGVELARNGQRTEVRAQREVLLCAGAINSPQLLLLSGVGPAEDLRRHGIEVVADLQGVGENLQDHPFVAVTFAAKRPISLANAERPWHLLNYLLRHRGPLTSNIAESGGFVRTSEGLETPDLQFHMAPAYFLDHGFVTPPGHGLSVGPTLVTSESRGRVSLASGDAKAPPRIDPNSLAHADDIERLVRGLKLARRIASMPAMRDLIDREHTPGHEHQSDEQLRDYIRRSVGLLYHPAGTCKMGRDAMAVVDPALCVRGVQGLRVIDASVMPRLVTGNTNAPTIMIAEKAASAILNAS